MPGSTCVVASAHVADIQSLSRQFLADSVQTIDRIPALSASTGRVAHLDLADQRHPASW